MTAKSRKPTGAELRAMRDQRPAVRPYEGQEASRREASFLTNLTAAQDDFDWIVANEAWAKLGHETFAGWWEARVQPIMRGLSMRPSRELALEAAEIIRGEEAHLPPSQRRRERELAETVGVTRDELREREDRSTSGGIPPKVDLHKDAPATQPEEDHPGTADLGEVEDPESSTADGDGTPSDAQPQADAVSNDAGSDETEAKGEAPRQPSAEVDLPQGQETAGVTVSVPAGDPEHSGRSEEQGQAAASIPAPGLAQLEKLLDEHVPDGDPHRKWRSAWLKAIKNAWGPASFAIADICANGDEDTFAALIDVRDFYDELLTKVQAERLRIAKAEQADLPDNVTPIRRTA